MPTEIPLIKTDLIADYLKMPLQMLMEVAPIGICITDHQGIFVSVSPAYCTIYNYSEEELIGKHFTIVTFEEDRSYWHNYYDEFWKQNLLWGEAEVRHRSGQRLYIIARALKLEEYKITFVLDITPIRKAENVIENQHKETLKRIVQGQEDERKRISAELHDGLGQLQTLAKLGVSNLEQITESTLIDKDETRVILNRRMFDHLQEHVQSVKHTFQDMYHELDKIISNLRPLPLTTNGLIPALEILCKRMSKVSTAVIQFFCDVDSDLHIESDAELHLYRIVQEIVSNAVKYAQAKHIYVQLVYEKPALILTVEDDGIGFNIAAAEAKKRLGLHSIQTRAKLINATLELDTQVNKGTSYVITFTP